MICMFAKIYLELKFVCIDQICKHLRTIRANTVHEVKYILTNCQQIFDDACVSSRCTNSKKKKKREQLLLCSVQSDIQRNRQFQYAHIIKKYLNHLNGTRICLQSNFIYQREFNARPKTTAIILLNAFLPQFVDSRKLI